MARKLVEFTKGYSRYNKGDTAAFDEEKAVALTTGKGAVGVIVGDAQELSAASAGQPVMGAAARSLLDSEHQELVLAGQNLAARLAEADQREAALDLREAELDAREKTIEEAATGNTKGPVPVTQNVDDPADEEGGDPDPQDKAPGAPPKQGAKK